MNEFILIMTLTMNNYAIPAEMQTITLNGKGACVAAGELWKLNLEKNENRVIRINYICVDSNKPVKQGE